MLVVHNYYQQPGGEDNVFHAEVQVLREHGHTVLEYSEQNKEIVGSNKIKLACDTIWSERSKNKLATALADFRPDVAHFHNTFPLISRSAYYACPAAGAPVVQTLHHYRTGRPKATYFRDGRLCNDCRTKLFAWSAVAHACDRSGRSTSWTIALIEFRSKSWATVP